jgi:hypothetical protein
MSTPQCPRSLLAHMAHRYPQAFKAADDLRADQGKEGLPTWPAWCFLPLAGALAIVTEGHPHPDTLPLERTADAALLGALMAWRPTQGVYRFDPDLFDPVVRTPLDRVPFEVLYRLPEWGVYVETPGLVFQGEALRGFLAHLEWDVNTQRTEVRFELNTHNGWRAMALHSEADSLQESVDQMWEEAARHAKARGVTLPMLPSDFRDDVQPLVSLLLYLCSESPDWGRGDRVPQRPSPTRTKKGMRFFPPTDVTVWSVGETVGETLRRSQVVMPAGEGKEGGAGTQKPESALAAGALAYVLGGQGTARGAPSVGVPCFGGGLTPFFGFQSTSPTKGGNLYTSFDMKSAELHQQQHGWGLSEAGPRTVPAPLSRGNPQPCCCFCFSCFLRATSQ